MIVMKKVHGSKPKPGPSPQIHVCVEFWPMLTGGCPRTYCAPTPSCYRTVLGLGLRFHDSKRLN